MRKDVKFGLTIGGILVVTLVIYVIVLSRGPAVPQKIGIAMPSPTDQPAASTGEATLPAHNSDVAKAQTDDQTDANAPVNGESTTPTSNTQSTPTETDGGSTTVTPTTPPPATQPATASNNNGNDDWDNALNHGLPPALSAPQRTETPTPSIDSTSTATASTAAPTTVTRPPTVPLIDPLPTTQPSRTQVASTPTIDPTPTPSPLYASAAPASPAPTSVSPTIPDDASSTPAAPNMPRTHRVAAGESPYSIAQAVYGNGKYYKLILAANPKVDPHRLRIGQILTIPELTDAEKSPARNSASVAPAAVDSNTQYVVASGDTLESISRKLYGSPAMIEKIYQANRSVIGSDENVLKIGWVLKLPEAPTSNGSTGEVRGN